MAATVARLQAVLGADTRGFDKDMRRAESRFGGLSKAAKLGGLAVAAGAAYGFKVFAEEAMEAEKVTAQTNAVLKSTGNAANVTAGQVDKLAQSLLMKSGVDDEQIKSGENMLLTFTKIRNEVGAGNNIFDQATKATLNLSVAMGKDMQSSAILVGKALNDPVKGMSALSRAGIQFTADQKEVITSLVKSGDTMSAQKMILKELETQFGGSAEAAGKTFAGQMNIARESMKNAGAEIAAQTLPTLAKLATTVATQVIPKLIEWGGAVRQHVQPVLEAIVGWVRNNWPTISRIFNEVLAVVRTALEDMVRVAQLAWPKIQEAAQRVIAWYKENLEPTIKSVVRNLQLLWSKYGEDIIAITRRVFGTLSAVIKPLLEAVVKVISGILALIRGDWQAAWDNFKQVPMLALQSVIAGIKGLATMFYDAAKVIGSEVINGIKDGLKAGAESLKQTVEHELHKNVIDYGKQILGIHSGSRVANEEIGQNISLGVAEGIIEKKKAITDALQQAAEEAISAAQSSVGSAVGRLTETLSFGFSAKQGAVKTPAERRLEAEQAAQQELQLAVSLDNAQKALLDARHIRNTQERKAAEAAAIAQIQDARQAILMAKLQAEAEIERRDLQERQTFEQQNYQARLNDLQTYLTSGEATAAGANKRISALMKDFGLTMGDLGALVGLSYADGIRAQIPAAVKAAQDLAASVAAKKVLDSREAAEKKEAERLTESVKAAEKAAAAVKSVASKVNINPFGKSSATETTPGVGNTNSNVTLGRQMAAAFGWTGSQFDALFTLWQGESGWNHLAKNPSSGAYGIPQSLPADKMAAAGGDYLTNPATQIAWGLNYIRGRYGSPQSALAAWNSRNPHWYHTGGIVPGVGNQPAVLRGGEGVFTRDQMRALGTVGGGSTTVNVNVAGAYVGERVIEDVVVQAILRARNKGRNV